MTTTTYTDPHNASIQRETDLTARAIINVCKRNGWPMRRIYGRWWVCADFTQRYMAAGMHPPASPLLGLDK